jgi:hypothetical protein
MITNPENINPFITFFTSDTYKYCTAIFDLFIGACILTMTAWISVQWINKWFIRHFGESFILSRASSDEFYASLFSRVHQNKDSSTDPCYICLEHVDNYIILPCSHRVHAACLKIWMDVSERCPMCRQRIN